MSFKLKILSLAESGRKVGYWKRTDFGKVRTLQLEELFMTGAGTWCAVKTLQCSTYRSHWVARVPKRILRRTLRNSFPAQLNGSGKVVISVGHLRVSHVFSLFDLFSSDYFAYSQLVLCSSIDTHLGGFFCFWLL